MSDIAVRVDRLSKRYRIGQREPYKMLRDTVTGAAGASLRRLSSLVRRRSIDHAQPQAASDGHIWALNDVSFEIGRGEVVGIIGRNGAGKSTLLKILSRITEPTAGYVEIHGRVGSLLEVGTGFNPELSGRENIYLNGAILGMKRAEIDRKFDEIVAFAEVEKFLDTPVKRYSSGMHMRLAFAVAAHLEPEILLVDEVLAVGDAAFQKKCLGKMGEVAREGRTVLFVSHNTAAVASLCDRGLLLNYGKLVDEGPVKRVVQRYLQSAISTSIIPLEQRLDRSGDGSIRIVSLRIESTEPDKVIRSSSRLRVTIGYRSDKPVWYPQFLVSVYDSADVGIYLLHSDLFGNLPESLPPEGSVTCLTDPINLTSGRCIVHVELLKGNVRADYISFAGYFDVEADDTYGPGKALPRNWVLCLLGQKWTLDGK
jgi:lipopolysaccharide transport system ATP-binding protein